MKLKTEINELSPRFEVDLPYSYLQISDRDIERETSDGSSKFFSKKEVEELADFLKKSNSPWRLPRLVELKVMIAMCEINEGCTDGLTGEDILVLLGNSDFSGKELISGSLRTPLNESATFYWSDPTVAGGIMKLDSKGASFELTRREQHSNEKPHGGFYDHPDSEIGCCVRLVREED